MLPESTINRIISNIKEVSNPISVILFGSYAYGSPKPGSDLDIAVIENHITSKIAEVQKLLTALKDIPFPKDIIVATRQEYDFYSKEAGSIFRTIAEKGMVIYG